MIDPNISPYLLGDFAPVHTELSTDALEVEGEVPKDLFGMYVRNGPNAQHTPKGRYHWFDGDGAVFRQGQ